MKAKVQFLNVGWGDAHIIRHPSGSVTLIDGGDGGSSPDQDHPVAWLNRNGMETLDWMILTHIHEDHQNGLLDVAKQIKVKKAVLPYDPFELPTEKRVQASGSALAMRVYRMLATYLELVQLLEAQGTEILWRSHFHSEESSVIWSEEGVALRHLYPWEGDPLPGYEAMMQAVQMEASSAKELHFRERLESFFSLSNDDSSVYRLHAEGRPSESVLFGGDQVESGWRILSDRMSLRSQVWKVSHHGLSDGFNANILSWIRPQHCVIPISAAQSQELLPYWVELRAETEAAFHLTGDVRPGENRMIVDGEMIQVEIG